MTTQPMKAMACAWMSGGAPKLERPIARLSEKPPAMVTAMTMAPPRKKPRSSRSGKDGSDSAIAAMAFPPERRCHHRILPSGPPPIQSLPKDA